MCRRRRAIAVLVTPVRPSPPNTPPPNTYLSNMPLPDGPPPSYDSMFNPNVPVGQGPNMVYDESRLVRVDQLRAEGAFLCCPQCSKVVVTETKYKAGKYVWLAAAGVLILNPLFVWAPFVYNGIRDVSHTCPNCGSQLAVYDRLRKKTRPSRRMRKLIKYQQYAPKTT
ncbi:uncharacterized protein VTP21DRAFT_2168 [Calcarisporiella thermophila]|uniref:uncharacterized protein n=1 Tax=Calcarisporiella thermophila TaxID=911321 RepID=UPI003742198C